MQPPGPRHWIHREGTPPGRCPRQSRRAQMSPGTPRGIDAPGYPRPACAAASPASSCARPSLRPEAGLDCQASSHPWRVALRAGGADPTCKLRDEGCQSVGRGEEHGVLHRPEATEVEAGRAVLSVTAVFEPDATATQTRVELVVLLVAFASDGSSRPEFARRPSRAPPSLTRPRGLRATRALWRVRHFWRIDTGAVRLADFSQRWAVRVTGAARAPAVRSPGTPTFPRLLEVRREREA